jgi:PAS domain S-box-containing protein
MRDRSVVDGGPEPTTAPIDVLDADLDGRRDLAAPSLDALIEHQLDFIVALDSRGRLSYVSPSVERAFEYRWEELAGRSVLDFVHPDDVDEVASFIGRHLGRPGRTPALEVRILARDGTSRTLEAIANNLLDDPTVRSILVNARDVSDRAATERELRAAEEALRRTEERYRTLVEQIPAAMYVDRIDPDGGGYTPVYVSPQIETMLGYDRSEWLESTPGWDSRWVHEEDREALIRATESAVARRESLSVEYRMTTADGHEMWIHEDSQPVGVDETGAVLRQGLMYDITERKRAEQMLRTSEAELQRGLEVLQRTDAERRQLLAHLLEAENAERERMAEGIEDHSLQHVAALGMRLETLRRNVEDPEQLGALDEMGETVQNAVQRLRHLLVELHPRALEQDGLGAGLRQYLNGVKADTGTAVTFIDGSKRELDLGTRVVAYRIAQEAIANAVRHAEASSLDVTLEDTPGGVLVRIVDDGRGFDPGGFASPEHVVVASMRERATLAGGRLDISSGPADGTTVEFWLPAELR